MLDMSNNNNIKIIVIICSKFSMKKINKIELFGPLEKNESINFDGLY